MSAADDARPGAASGAGGAAVVGRVISMFAGFVPWIAYWAMIGSVSFRLAVTIAFMLTLAVSGAALVRGHRPKVFELGGVAVFALLMIATFATDDSFLERWIQPLSNAGLFAVSLASLVIGRPWTLEYAREAVSAEVAALPGFAYINRVITIVWTVAFAIMTLAAFVPPLIEGDATMREGGSTLSIVGYWVVPFTVLGLAAVFSSKFPDWFTSRLDAPPLAAAGPPAPLPTTAAPQAAGLELSVSPADALLDVVPQIAVRGASPGAKVRFEARTIDALGRGWRSWAECSADESGAVELAAAKPSDGTYADADPAGLIWSMGAEDPATDLFVPSLDAGALSLVAESDGTKVSELAVRRGREPGVEVVELDGDDGVRARLFLPAAPGPHPGVAVFGGSEGGLDSMSSTAAMLASHGYAAAVVALFGVEGKPAHLIELPLEGFAAGIKALADRPEVDAERVGALAISKGAEGLLSATARIGTPRVAAVVAISPSSLAWQAIGEEGPAPGKSSWTLGSEPVSFAEMRSEALMPEMLRNAAFQGLDRRRHRPTLLHIAVAYSLDGTGQADAAIPVERIEAPLLLLSGEADEIWPSTEMAAAIAARRQGSPANDGDEKRSYPDAGHLIRMPLIPTSGLWTGGVAFGGTAAGLAAAQADAGPRILAFLDRHLR